MWSHQAVTEHQDGFCTSSTPRLLVRCLQRQRLYCWHLRRAHAQQNQPQWGRQGFDLVLIHPKSSPKCKDRTSPKGSWACERVRAQRARNCSPAAAAASLGDCVQQEGFEPWFQRFGRGSSEAMQKSSQMGPGRVPGPPKLPLPSFAHRDQQSGLGQPR